ncbi:MAG: hypothetical protein SFW65_00965 [Alphaproteobacteria bacterium]|nr:hypothetical protein [Alphaproteobacteria bacterium]
MPFSFSASSFLKCFLIAVLMLGTSAGDVHAKTKESAKAASKKAESKSEAKSDVAQPKEKWQVGMIKGEKGEFNYCLMRAEFNNDLSFAIALSPKQEINLGIGVPKAGFTKDEKHQMNVSIGSVYNKDAVAVAANPELLLIPMHEDSKLMDALRGGKMIALTGKEDSTKFALKNMPQALDGLKTCVDVGTGKKPMPQQPAEAPAGKDGKKAAAKEIKFPPSLKALLDKAGLKDLEILTIKDPSRAPVDFGWKTQGLFGGMRERPVPAEATMEKMTELMEGGYKKQCSGTFNVTKGEIENYSGIQMRTMNVGCEMKEHNAYVALFIYLTDNHLFTMFMHEGDGTNKDAANKARDQVANLLRQIAKEPPPSSAKSTAPAASAPAPAPATPAAPATKP